jgi:hypothetical protein
MYILLEEISSIQVNQFNQSHIHFYDISTCLYRYPDSHPTATQEENPLVEKTAPDLTALILKSQGTDPLCVKVKKELGQSGQNSREGYTLDQRGLLFYKDRVVVPA